MLKKSFYDYQVKGSEVGCALPSTSIAAHAIDELIEAVETEDRFEAVEGTPVFENGAIDNKASSSYMPPPPPPPRIDLNAYRQVKIIDRILFVCGVHNY